MGIISLYKLQTPVLPLESFFECVDLRLYCCKLRFADHDLVSVIHNSEECLPLHPNFVYNSQYYKGAEASLVSII